MSQKQNVKGYEMSKEMKCHEDKMSQKGKCHKIGLLHKNCIVTNWGNVTKDEMSQKMKLHKTENVTKHEMSLRINATK